MQEHDLFTQFLSEIQYCSKSKSVMKCIKSVTRKWIRKYHPDKSKNVNLNFLIQYLVGILSLRVNELHNMIVNVSEPEMKLVA